MMLGKREWNAITAKGRGGSPDFEASNMSTISSDGSLHGVAKAMAQMAKLRNGEITQSNHSFKVISLRLPTAEEQAEIKAQNARDAETLSQMEKEAAQARTPLNIDRQDTYLPNITSLSLESAIKMKDFVEIDIEQGLDNGNIHGRYGDKPVSSLKDYLSLINDYINSKSASDASSSSAQPSTSAETTPAATETSTAPATAKDRSPTLAELIANPPRVTDINARPEITLATPSPEELAELNAFKARTEEKLAKSRKEIAELEVRNHLENHDVNLPNITSLDVDLARTVKGFIEVDIDQNTDKGMTVFGYYGDKRIDNLKDYLSLITDYIDGKSVSDTSSPSAQSSISTDATPPVTSTTATTAPTSALADTATATSPPSTPATNADPNWTEPVAEPGQNQIFFPNAQSLTRETAAAVYQQVSSMVKTQDISTSVIHAHNGSTGTLSIDTYMSWLAQRAATDIRV